MCCAAGLLDRHVASRSYRVENPGHHEHAQRAEPAPQPADHADTGHHQPQEAGREIRQRYDVRLS